MFLPHGAVCFEVIVFLPFVLVSNKEYILNLGMTYRFEKIALFHSLNFRHCMPCSSRVISDMTSQIC